MNKFRILGIIAIIAIIANFFGGLNENWRDFKEGFNEGQNNAMKMYEPGHHIIPYNATRAKLNVEPLPGTTVDSLNNNRVAWALPDTVPSRAAKYSFPPMCDASAGLHIPVQA